ncbi:phosphate ABC transporter substrate-binding protein [Pseudoalteromonas citrea]|uniref:Phosphate ABC transporter substrate-binding protein n=1 Tax=Pseudoalteromonas citrea TaxID=43655 RepID=A0A5S3XWZ9_9GAMM|nr:MULTISPECIES: phosphate ABC transporter substrate-binding protein [Pseudoalteromonas]RJE77522.1 phosphate ABC transporter substrate-binding protein [Pseudoalteromonas sp. MSK9-3]TMP42190.1 phosphate ABC transporter substrate-binding protein [Pseudoalteromonas citrea]TMP62340.1 phosphate ABC transporter substrate-binding protein [Pseudoalteromonas citrea]
MKKLMCLLLLTTASSAYAAVSVIVHPSNGSSFESSTIKRIFTGKEKSFSNGNKVIPISQEAGSAVTDEFNDKVLNKSSAQLKAYWSKLIFTGKGTPPKEVSNDAEVLKMISANPDTIGFVSSDAVTDQVKVIKQF